MGEEHQLGPGEQITMGIAQPLFDAVCAGCHGSVSGHEIDVVVTPDALTGASASKSATAAPMAIGP
jgi:mono/diheme cytochrome c family protein